jgi:hypothetical protein
MLNQMSYFRMIAGRWIHPLSNRLSTYPDLFNINNAKNLDDLATFVETSVAGTKIRQLPFLKKF